MSLTLAPVDLSAAQVGASATVSFGALVTVPTPLQPGPAPLAHALLQNESGVGLQVTFPRGNVQFYLAAGEWRLVALDPNEQNFRYTVQYTLANPPVSSLFFTYYAPGETPSPPGILGNSPIGLSGSVPTAVTQVIQDGQATGGTIVESTPNTGRDAGVQTILMTTDGLLKLQQLGQAAGSDNAYLVLIQQGNGTAVAQTIFISVNGNGALDIFDNNAGKSILFATGNGARIPALTQVGGQNAVGSFGVPVVGSLAKHVSVTTTAQVTVASVTTPNNGQNCWVRYSFFFVVGGANTNNGVITAQGTYTSPDTASSAEPFFPVGSTTQLIAAAIPKGSVISCVATCILCSPNTVVTITYQNTAAGTIGDTVSGSIELLG